MQVRKMEVPYRIDMHLKKNKSKGIAVNGVPIHRATELFGIINIIFFSPEDLNLIKNGPAERRRFIDMELSQLDKIYLNNLVNYNKVVAQRNRLLKDLSFNPSKEKYETLDIWDMQLVTYGSEIIKRRRLFLKELESLIVGIHEKLSGGKEKLNILYNPNVSEENFEAEIRRMRDRDLQCKMTSTGPHKDDISFFVNGRDVRKYGSQGQQRTAALSLKLSEIELVKKLIHDTPVLLLDDVLSELDSSRQQFLLDSIGGIQTIVTCTGLDDFVNGQFAVHKIFHVVNGTVSSEN
jgi:DNA replication and repair protein RecF